jgi:hypothetical protein
MKPRLESLPLTDEDRRIQQSIALRQSESVFDWTTWMRRMTSADRRDAALMWSMAHVAAKHGYTTKERQQVLALYFGDPLGIPLVANEDVA